MGRDLKGRNHQEESYFHNLELGEEPIMMVLEVGKEPLQSTEVYSLQLRQRSQQMMKVIKRVRPRSETPPLDFDSEDDYGDDEGYKVIYIPCFRVVVTRNKIPALDSDSESEHSTDSDIEPQSSSSTESLSMDSELSDSK